MKAYQLTLMRAHLVACCTAITGLDVPRGKMRWFQVYPRWLPYTLLRQAKGTRSFLQSDNALLSPVEARTRLENFQNAASLISSELTDHAFFAYLGHHGEAAGHSAYQVLKVIEDLAKQSAEAIGGLPSGQGKQIAHAFDPERTISGYQYCAWVVRRAFEEQTGKPPGVRNDRAVDAANALIMLSGGSGLTLEGWRKHFTTVRNLEGSDGFVGRQLRSRKESFISRPGGV